MTTTPVTQPETADPTAGAAAVAEFEQTMTDALATFTDRLINAGQHVDLPGGYTWPNQLVPYLQDTDRPAVAGLVGARVEQRRRQAADQPHGLQAVDAATGYCICGETFPGPPAVTVDAVLAHLQERAAAAGG